MNAADQVSLDALEAIAERLGDTSQAREMIQSAYNLGKIEATKNAISKYREVVAA